MKNLILITFVFISVFAFGQNIQTLTPEMVNQNSPFVSENSLRGQAVRAFKSGSSLPHGSSLEYTAQDRLVSFSKNESRSGLTDGAYILPAGSPVIRIGNTYYYPYCGNRFSTFSIMEKETEYITNTQYIERTDCNCNPQQVTYQPQPMNYQPSQQYMPQGDCTIALQQARSLDMSYRNRQIRYKVYLNRLDQLRLMYPHCPISEALRRNNDGVKVAYAGGGFILGYATGKLTGRESNSTIPYDPITPVDDPDNHGGEDDYHPGSTPVTPVYDPNNQGGGYNGGSQGRRTVQVVKSFLNF